MIYAGILAGGTGSRMGDYGYAQTIFGFGWTSYFNPHG